MHTILRRPAGTFCARGVTPKVVLFDARLKDGAVHTQGVWFHDWRTNKRYTLKTRQLACEDWADFVTCYRLENRHLRESSERFRHFGYDELISRDKAKQH